MCCKQWNIFLLDDEGGVYTSSTSASDFPSEACRCVVLTDSTGTLRTKYELATTVPVFMFTGYGFCPLCKWTYPYVFHMSTLAFIILQIFFKMLLNFMQLERTKH